MHVEAYEYIRRQLSGYSVAGANVLELGAYNVNGSVRSLLAGCGGYVGVDSRPGPGVDVATPGELFDGAGAFDLVISTETLEHAAQPRALIGAAWRALRPGGVLLLTAACCCREPHSCDGGPIVPPDEHYAGIEPDELRRWLGAWRGVRLEHHPARGDVYARAVKPEEPSEVA